jgi:hypothetical protein
VLAFLALLPPLSVSGQSWSPPRTVFVPTTGHTSDGLFLDVWREQRDLLGDPITEELKPKSNFAASDGADVIQFYEHLALVYLPNESPESQVQALDLGAQLLAATTGAGASRALQRASERTVCAPGTADVCTTVVGSGHTVRGAFRDYWLEGNSAYWLGLPITESFPAPDGVRVQYFQNGILRQTEQGGVEPLPLGKSAAKRAKVTTEPIRQPDDVPEYSEELFIPPPAEATPVDTTDWAFGPGPQQGAWKEVVISISSQSMWAYENGEVVMSSLVSTGTAEVPETTTPIGFHAVVAKFDAQTMEGTISGEYYRVEDVPYVMYFDDLGNALHGTYWHSNFGAPMSHGCVNLPMDIAAWMYEWAPVGTAVTVVG